MYLCRVDGYGKFPKPAINNLGVAYDMQSLEGESVIAAFILLDYRAHGFSDSA